MEHLSLRTTDHDLVREWVEDRGGRPALALTPDGMDTALRIDFGDAGDELEEVTWNEFFKLFEDNELALAYEEVAADGSESYEYSFVSRNALEEGVEDIPGEVEEF